MEHLMNVVLGNTYSGAFEERHPGFFHHKCLWESSAKAHPLLFSLVKQRSVRVNAGGKGQKLFFSVSVWKIRCMNARTTQMWTQTVIYYSLRYICKPFRSILFKIQFLRIFSKGFEFETQIDLGFSE